MTPAEMTDHLNLTWFSSALSRPEAMLGRTARAFDTILYELNLPVKQVIDGAPEL